MTSLPTAGGPFGSRIFPGISVPNMIGRSLWNRSTCSWQKKKSTSRSNCWGGIVGLIGIEEESTVVGGAVSFGS